MVMLMMITMVTMMTKMMIIIIMNNNKMIIMMMILVFSLGSNNYIYSTGVWNRRFLRRTRLRKIWRGQYRGYLV